MVNIKQMNKSLGLLMVSGFLSFASAQAQLANRYDLSDANDSVGGANGTVQGGAVLSGGILTTTNANNTSYLRLPGAATNPNPAPAANVSGDFSVELWATQAGSQSGNTVVFSLASAQTNFLLLKPNNNGTGPTINFRQAGINGGNEVVAHTSANGASSIFNNGSFGAEYQIVLTYSFNTGAFTLYRNGAQYGNLTYQSGTTTGTVLTSLPIGFNLSSATAGAFNGINGGNPFGDNNFNGSTNDFRVYSSALNDAQVASLFNAGPNATNAAINTIAAVPEPSTWAALVAGAGALLGWQRRTRREVV